MAFASRQARGRRRGGITALARSPFLAAFLASVRRIPNQSSDKLCERVKPESIVWIDLFLQCLDGFRHRWRSKDHGCRNRRANIIGLRVRSTEVDYQTVHFARLVNDKIGEIDNRLSLADRFVFGVIHRDKNQGNSRFSWTFGCLGLS